MPAKHIAIITCSTRTPRLNPTITQYVYDVLIKDPTLPTDHTASSTTPTQSTSTHPPPSSSSIDTNPRHITFSIVDLSAQNLPPNNEPNVPVNLPPSNPTRYYAHTHSRAWSRLVSSYAGFIFVTPQYNWSIPASLKNALDYLFHEWRGKPVGIVSYGSRGGKKAAEHLGEICTGLGMRVVGTKPGLVVRFTRVPIGEDGGGGEETVLDSRDVKGWKQAGMEGMMRNMGMEIVCELDKE